MLSHHLYFKLNATPLNMGPICGPKVLVINYHSMLHKIPKEHRSQDKPGFLRLDYLHTLTKFYMNLYLIHVTYWSNSSVQSGEINSNDH
jgi:hypothetical protein